MRKSHATMIQTLKLLNPRDCPFVANMWVHIRGKQNRFTARFVSQDGDLITVINVDDDLYVEFLLDELLTIEILVKEEVAILTGINPPTPHKLRAYMSKRLNKG